MAQGFAAFKAALERQGLTVIEANPIAELPAPVAAHADMLLHSLGGGKLIAASGAQPLIEQLCGFGYTVIAQDGIAPEYPKDAALNCFALGGRLYCNPKAASRTLLAHYKAIGTEIVPVKQGYAKCSACIVDERSIITADPSIAKAAGSNGLDVLKIRSGYISLPGLDYGFIGGAAGLIAKGKLALFGSLDTHPDSGAIRQFCMARGVDIIELADSPLIDIGGIVCL
jgi:hypothetical protein